MTIHKTAAVFSLGLLSANVSAIDFTYLNGDPLNGYNRLGTPNNMIDRSADMPTDILNNIYSMLPESQYVNPAYVDTNLKSNIIVDSDFEGIVTATVTFLNEGAGYRNSFGYFIYDPTNPPATYNDIDEHVIVLPNASKPTQGELAQGDTVELNVNLVAGQALGFFIVPNGWSYTGSYGTVSGLGPWGQPFYSLPHLNPEPAGLKNHNVVFYDSVNDFFVFGFDDQHRNSGDNDFNDLLVSVETTPIYAVEGINEDGSVDANSYQVLEQSNTEITSTSYYPSQNGRATMAFEDLWPRMGDYDFNDVIVSYQFEQTLNNRNKLINLKMTFDIQAMGASYHNGLNLHLPGVLANQIQSATLTKNGTLVNDDLLEAGHLEAHLTLFNDLKTTISSVCNMYRTLTDCTEEADGIYVLNISFTEAIDTAVIGSAPYDTYLFATDNKYHGLYGTRSWEVHSKLHDGSSLFDTSLLGLQDDRSTGQQTFVNKNNFPWVINIPGNWQHPKENADILRAYPLFKTWVTSDGKQANNWYQPENANPDLLY